MDRNILKMFHSKFKRFNSSKTGPISGNVEGNNIKNDTTQMNYLKSDHLYYDIGDDYKKAYNLILNLRKRDYTFSSELSNQDYLHIYFSNKYDPAGIIANLAKDFRVSQERISRLSVNPDLKEYRRSIKNTMIEDNKQIAINMLTEMLDKAERLENTKILLINLRQSYYDTRNNRLNYFSTKYNHKGTIHSIMTNVESELNKLNYEKSTNKNIETGGSAIESKTFSLINKLRLKKTNKKEIENPIEEYVVPDRLVIRKIPCEDLIYMVYNGRDTYTNFINQINNEYGFLSADGKTKTPIFYNAYELPYSYDDCSVKTANEIPSLLTTTRVPSAFKGLSSMHWSIKFGCIKFKHSIHNIKDIAILLSNTHNQHQKGRLSSIIDGLSTVVGSNFELLHLFPKLASLAASWVGLSEFSDNGSIHTHSAKNSLQNSPGSVNFVEVDILNNNDHIIKHISIDNYIFFTIGITFILLLLSIFLRKKFRDNSKDTKKGTPYECGLNPSAVISSRNIEVTSIVPPLLFIVLDLEILFAIPFSIHADTTNQMLAIWLFYVTFTIFGLALIIEWLSNAISPNGGYFKFGKNKQPLVDVADPATKIQR